jgi:hypothetical protein
MVCHLCKYGGDEKNDKADAGHNWEHIETRLSAQQSTRVTKCIGDGVHTL